MSKKFDDSDDWSEYKKVDKKKSKPRKDDDKWSNNSTHLYDNSYNQDVFRKNKKMRY